ncbi:hypothetical protein PENSPDRAFT_671654 [Peniophora sp. CONT]|nr:hypothetical protein PENSPDRAFT_671654 [Peniophora sp. CONT]
MSRDRHTMNRRSNSRDLLLQESGIHCVARMHAHPSVQEMMSGFVVCKSGLMADSCNRVGRHQPDALLAVRTLHLTLGRARSDLGPVRDLIASCLHVVSLTVLISTRPPKRLLPASPFTHLTTFATNLPHASLRAFLCRLSHLKRLTLTSNCYPSRDCSLHSVPLPALCEISCGWIPCIRAFTVSKFVRKVVVPVPSDGASGHILASPLPMSSTILSLHLPFTGTEVPRLVHSIALAAPNVETLCLEEYHGALHLESMPFAVHRHVFAGDLRLLPRLRHLRLKICHRISLPADNDHAAVQQWLSLCGQSSALTTVTVWSETAMAAPDVGKVRVWRREGLGRWVKATDRVGVSDDQSWGKD